VDKFRENLGEPDIKMGGLQIWVHGRQYPDADDYWDGNWLNVTAHCGASGASVWTSGAIFSTYDIKKWLDHSEEMNRTLNGDANLVSLEPELVVEMKMESRGHIAMRVEITPIYDGTQGHFFEFSLDQSFLPDHIQRCHKLMTRFPVKGTPPSAQ
jgi:hypothetical protein